MKGWGTTRGEGAGHPNIRPYLALSVGWSLNVSYYNILCTGCQYQVMVQIGDRWGSETDADLYITLFGENGDSGLQWLKDSDNDEKFLKNQVWFVTYFCLKYLFSLRKN